MGQIIILAGAAWLLLHLLSTPRRGQEPRVEYVRVVRDSDEPHYGELGASLLIFLAIVVAVTMSLSMT